MDERFVEEVEAAEQHGGPIAAPTEEATARRGRALYALSAGLLSGRGLKVLQGVAQRNGFEAWRQVVAEFAPRIVQRRFGGAAEDPNTEDVPGLAARGHLAAGGVCEGARGLGVHHDR